MEAINLKMKFSASEREYRAYTSKVVPSFYEMHNFTKYGFPPTSSGSSQLITVSLNYSNDVKKALEKMEELQKQIFAYEQTSYCDVPDSIMEKFDVIPIYLKEVIYCNLSLSVENNKDANEKQMLNYGASAFNNKDGVLATNEYRKLAIDLTLTKISASILSLK